MKVSLSGRDQGNSIRVSIDHSFLNYKKELLDYGFKVGKISLKEQTVIFSREISSPVK